MVLQECTVHLCWVGVGKGGGEMGVTVFVIRGKCVLCFRWCSVEGSWRRVLLGQKAGLSLFTLYYHRFMRVTGIELS